MEQETQELKLKLQRDLEAMKQQNHRQLEEIRRRNEDDIRNLNHERLERERLERERLERERIERERIERERMERIERERMERIERERRERERNERESLYQPQVHFPMDPGQYSNIRQPDGFFHSYQYPLQQQQNQLQPSLQQAISSADNLHQQPSYDVRFSPQFSSTPFIRIILFQANGGVRKFLSMPTNISFFVFVNLVEERLNAHARVSKLSLLNDSVILEDDSDVFHLRDGDEVTVAFKD
jgi:hypothetical protein